MKISRWAKKAVTQLFNQSPEQIINMISKTQCKVVSFDVFDTLIKRNVPEPKDVFALLEQQFERQFGRKVPIGQIRMAAEQKAALETAYKEVNLREIYAAIDNLSNTEKQWLMEKEKHIEYCVCQRCPSIGKIYDYCLSQGIPVILISDMYLPREVIENILHQAGYEGWRRLYVSADVRKNKSDGSLFDYVLSQEKLSPKEMFHIGDSLRGDFITPRRQGVKAALISERKIQCYFNKKQYKSEEKKHELCYRVIHTLVRNNIDRYDGFYQRLGYAVIGPILYGYCKWVAARVREDHISKIFFLAREGYFLKRGFDLFNYDDIRSEVIQVSRRAVSHPLLNRAQNLEELLRFITKDRAEFTVNKLLISCGIEKQESLQIIQGLNISPNEEISALTKEKSEKLFKGLKPLIDANANEQEENIRGYLAQFDFSGPMALCDIGWQGTIQYCLQEIFPSEVMMGLYVGKYENLLKPKVHSSAFLFENTTNHKIFQCVMGAASLLEIFFSCGGSASHYEHLADGTYICKELPPEQTESSQESIRSLQDAACAFVIDFKRLDDELEIELGPFSCTAAYRQFITHLNNKAIHELREFSLLNVDTRSLIAKHSLIWYVLRPKQFVSDFLNNGSKAIFLKSIFKLPLPYVEIVDSLRKFEKK